MKFCCEGAEKLVPTPGVWGGGREAGYAGRAPVMTQDEEERAREGRGLSPLSPAGLKPAAGL
jgi:hypothetical protein